MKKFLISASIISVLLTYFLIMLVRKHGKCAAARVKIHEGFTAKERIDKANVQVTNALVNVMGKLKKMTGILINPSFWQEQMTMKNMNVMELARYQIQKTAGGRA